MAHPVRPTTVRQLDPMVKGLRVRTTASRETYIDDRLIWLVFRPNVFQHVTKPASSKLKLESILNRLAKPVNPHWVRE
jgi:hypothetical protein